MGRSTLYLVEARAGPVKNRVSPTIDRQGRDPFATCHESTTDASCINHEFWVRYTALFRVFGPHGGQAEWAHRKGTLCVVIVSDSPRLSSSRSMFESEAPVGLTRASYSLVMPWFEDWRT